jgi:nucleoside 2-deoxyribosyltransferase
MDASIQTGLQEDIARLEQLRALIEVYRADNRRQRRIRGGGDPLADLRARINREVHWARQRVIEAGCFGTYTIGPPPAVGGLVFRNVDPFASLFNSPYGKDFTSEVIDMLDRTMGVLLTPPREQANDGEKAVVMASIRRNFAFVAMAIDDNRPELDDLLDAIKEAADRCGIQAERVDEEQTNERITDRMLASIKSAEYVIVDLSDERPNVFYEAGFAHGLGKIPIYIAKAGTKLHFDLKDYPVIFFRSLKQLKDKLEARLRANAAKRSKPSQ